MACRLGGVPYTASMILMYDIPPLTARNQCSPIMRPKERLPFVVHADWSLLLERLSLMLTPMFVRGEREYDMDTAPLRLSVLGMTRTSVLSSTCWPPAETDEKLKLKREE